VSNNKPEYIVIEGPIGVGKTSLARRLADIFHSELLLEGADKNPFLERFYNNPRATAFQTQLFFLLQRAQQMQDLRQGDIFSPVRVADFLLEKDRLFAQLTLDDDELRLYDQVYNQLTLDAPRPDLVIYLQAPVDVLEDRIRQRAIPSEQQITREYLQGVVDAYARLFHFYNATPLLIVNAAEIDPLANEADFQALLNQVYTIKSGRQYFNPLPSLLSGGS